MNKPRPLEKDRDYVECMGCGHMYFIHWEYGNGTWFTSNPWNEENTNDMHLVRDSDYFGCLGRVSVIIGYKKNGNIIYKYNPCRCRKFKSIKIIPNVIGPYCNLITSSSS